MLTIQENYSKKEMTIKQKNALSFFEPLVDTTKPITMDSLGQVIFTNKQENILMLITRKGNYQKIPA